MNINGTHLEIQRVEIIRRVFNKQNQIIEEQIEYYSPNEKSNVITGFKAKKRK